MPAPLDGTTRRVDSPPTATRVTGGLRLALQRLDQRIFAAADQRMIEAGLDVLRPRLFRRTYRDPRWNQRW